MVNEQELQQLLQTAFPDGKIIIGGDGYHFEVKMISEQFQGLSKIARQRLVYKVVEKEIKSGNLHALSLKTLTPKEVEEEKRG